MSGLDLCASNTARGVVARVEEIARGAPDALAIHAPGVQLTYGELIVRARHLGSQLRAAGVDREHLIALCLPRSVDLVVGALGTLVAGAGYVALDPDQSDARLKTMIEDCGATALVAGVDIADRVGANLPVIAPGAGRGSGGSCDRAEPRADAAAYAVYTSGSTGRPKGVLVAHGGLLNLIDWHHSTFEISPSDRTTLIANPGFDASVWEMWPSLTAGASLHVPPDQIRTDPVRLRDWLLAERITVCFLPTALAEAITSIAWPMSAPLRFVLTGGDVLHRRPPADVPFTLVNNYGVAEATVVSTSMSVSPARGGLESAPSVGFPIDGVTVRIVDGDGHVLPNGADGELLICGPSVALGYLGHAAEERERFTVDPLDSDVRAYRTGDRARINEYGSIDFLGRLDDQVQIRGFRVEPAEIVGVVNRHPDVVTSALTPIDDVNGTQLVLGVVTRHGRQVDDLGLRAYLAEHLPQHMVPARIVELPTLPITPNGKIDLAVLAALAEPPPPPTEDGPGPRNEVEAALADTVAELLKFPRVAVDANFFLLGGHSMLGAQLIVRVAELYGVEMTLLTLFDNPTVAQMAAEIERRLVEEIAGMSDDELLSANDQLMNSGTDL